MQGAELFHVYGSGSSANYVAVANNDNVSPPFKIFYLNDDLTGVSSNNYTSASGVIVLERRRIRQQLPGVQCAAGQSSCTGTYPQILIGSRTSTILGTVFTEGLANPQCGM